MNMTRRYTSKRGQMETACLKVTRMITAPRITSMTSWSHTSKLASIACQGGHVRELSLQNTKEGQRSKGTHVLTGVNAMVMSIRSSLSAFSMRRFMIRACSSGDTDLCPGVTPFVPLRGLGLGLAVLAYRLEIRGIIVVLSAKQEGRPKIRWTGLTW
jgi:hypothetical protein